MTTIEPKRFGHALWIDTSSGCKFFDTAWRAWHRHSIPRYRPDKSSGMRLGLAQYQKNIGKSDKGKSWIPRGYGV